MALRKRRPGLVYPVREDWHYVGEAGEPAFGTDWANASGVDRNLAFRIRETGVVDIQGYVENTDSPSAAGSNTIFVLPAAYRPSATAIHTAAGQLATSGYFVPIQISMSTNGNVTIPDATVSPYPAPGATTVLRLVHIAAQFFLDPASTP